MMKKCQSRRQNIYAPNRALQFMKRNLLKLQKETNLQIFSEIYFILLPQ